MNVSQCKAGRVEQQKYETGIQLHNLGVLGVYDMTLEAVISKTMLYSINSQMMLVNLQLNF